MAKSTYHVCYHCKDRTYDCHAKCELYKNEREAATKAREEQRRIHDIMQAAKSFSFSGSSPIPKFARESKRRRK